MEHTGTNREAGTGTWRESARKAKGKYANDGRAPTRQTSKREFWYSNENVQNITFIVRRCFG